MQVKCCECRRFRHGDKWHKAQERALRNGPISHGYCPPCLSDLKREIAKGAHVGESVLTVNRIGR